MSSPCLGLSILGNCSYDPSIPTSIYFSLGDVVAALTITVLIPQFLKPIYRFRLRARGLSIERIYLLVFFAAASIFVASLLPHLPIMHSSLFGYPIVWEIFGAALFSITYSLLVLASAVPVNVRKFRTKTFCIEAANFLARADGKDYAEFAIDLAKSLPTLLETAAFNGPFREWNAFTEFTHKEKLLDSAYAASFLRIISDQDFCKTLVSKSSWLTASMLNEISRKKIVCSHGHFFVQSVAYQAVTNPLSMLAREAGYHGFHAAPVLSDALFYNHFIHKYYEPFDWLFMHRDIDLTAQIFECLNIAMRKSVSITLKEEAYWERWSHHAMVENYISLCEQALRTGDHPRNSIGALETIGISNILTDVRKHLAKLSPEARHQMYQKEEQESPGMEPVFISAIAELAYKSLEIISNDFRGYKDPNWLFAHEIFKAVFPSIIDYADYAGGKPYTCDPLQQRVAIMLIKKLRENMEGFYPAISRVLLALIGPYERKVEIKDSAAFKLLSDNFYAELQRFSEIRKRRSVSLSDFLPENVTYDPDNNALTHTFSDGETRITMLALLRFDQPPSFFRIENFC